MTRRKKRNLEGTTMNESTFIPGCIAVMGMPVICMIGLAATTGGFSGQNRVPNENTQVLCEAALEDHGELYDECNHVRRTRNQYYDKCPDSKNYDGVWQQYYVTLITDNFFPRDQGFIYCIYTSFKDEELNNQEQVCDRYPSWVGMSSELK